MALYNKLEKLQKKKILHYHYDLRIFPLKFSDVCFQAWKLPVQQFFWWKKCLEVQYLCGHDPIIVKEWKGNLLNFKTGFSANFRSQHNVKNV